MNRCLSLITAEADGICDQHHERCFNLVLIHIAPPRILNVFECNMLFS